MNKLEECICYLKSHKGFHQLLCGMREKYISLSRVGGTIKLVNLTQEEKADLLGFFPKLREKNKIITISAEEFQHALAETKFSEISVEMILEAYFGESLESKQEQKKREELEWNQYLDKVQAPYQDTFSGNWMQKIRKIGSTSSAYVLLKQHYNEDKEQFAYILDAVLQSANQFPVFFGSEKALALFAADITGSPHFFDEGTKANRLLVYLMEEYVALQGSDISGWYEEKVYEVERKNELYYQVGLTKDDISNRSVIYGVHLRKSSGTLHAGIEGFLKEKEPVTVMLHQMHKIKEVFSDTKEIYVFENPSVFSAFLEMTKTIHISAMCTNGQLSLTSLLLLDQFVQSGGTIFYAGDFDPEGLQIADKLKIRYKEHFVLWHYNEEDYRRSKSSVEFNQRRLQKLKGIQSKELEVMKEILLEEKKAGYQERLMDVYVKEIREKYRKL